MERRSAQHKYDQIVKSGGAKPALLPFDLETAGAAEYQALHDALEREFGRLDGLAHGAHGEGQPHQRAAEES